jgi:hypothetical protein
MSNFCGCGDGTNGNTGYVNKEGVLFKKTLAGYLMFTEDEDGNLNCINQSDFVDGVLPASFIEGKLKETDPSKRWYPITQLEQVTSVRGDRALSTAETGVNQRTTAIAVRPFSAMVEYGGAVFMRNLNRFTCDQLSIFKVDVCGTLSGEVKSDDKTKLLPWKIAYGNWYPNMIWAEGDEKGMGNIQFEFDSSIDDLNEELVPKEYLALDLTSQQGLRNVTQSITNITNTTFTADLALEYGAFGQKCPQTGLVLADFVLYDVTAGAPVAISSVTPTSIKGQYNFITAAMTATNTMELRQSDTAGVYDKPFEFVVSPFTAV